MVQAYRMSRDTALLMHEAFGFWCTYRLVHPQFLLVGGTVTSQPTASVLGKRKLNTIAQAVEANLFYVILSM